MSAVRLLADIPEPQNWTCPAHDVEYGKDWAFTDRAWTCPACQRLARDEERAWEDECRNYRWWESCSGIPYRFHSKGLADWDRSTPANVRIGQALDSYAGDLRKHVSAGQGLALLGPPGLGKTHILTALVAEGCKLGLQPVYAVWPDVLADVKGRFGRKRRPDEGDDALGGLKATRLLALDELALKHSASEYDIGLLFELLDFRYREQLCTLVASNATASTLGESVGERLADRLKECAVTLVLSGASQRGTAKSQGHGQFAKPAPGIHIRVHSMGKWSQRAIGKPEVAAQ